MLPIGNAAGALFVTEATVQLSAVTGVPSATPVAVHDAFAETVTLAGAVIEGNTLSITTTVEEHVVETLVLSVKV